MANPRPEKPCSYHRERATEERKAATRSSHDRVREAHLELAMQHEVAQAIMWYRQDFELD